MSSGSDSVKVAIAVVLGRSVTGLVKGWR